MASSDHNAQHHDLPSGTSPAQAPDRAARNRRNTRIAGAVIAVASILILARALLTPAPAAPASTTGQSSGPGAAAPLPGHYAPNVTLVDLNNNHVDVASLRGKVVILNFWYVACEPCRYEMPALEKAYQEGESQGLVVVGVDISDDSQTITDFTHQLGITYPILRDINQRATVTYHVTGTPSSFFLDRQGVIQHIVKGPLDTATLQQYTSDLLAAK